MLKLTLMIALLGSSITAGDMGSGGYQCPPEGCPPPPPPICTVDCGGTSMQSGETESAGGSADLANLSIESIAMDFVEARYWLLTF